MKGRDRTQVNPIQPLAFFEETVQLPHIRHRNLRPPILFNHAFYFFSERLNVLWLCGKVEQRVREALFIGSKQKRGCWLLGDVPKRTEKDLR